jgi:RNA polymerase sigma-70 factor (ECF subfamily)
MDQQKSSNAIVKEWVYKYGDTLYSWALYKTGMPEVAEDIVQETFLAALQSFSRFNGKSSAKSWLFAILNNKIADYYRSKYAREQSFSSSQYPFQEDTAIHLADSSFDEHGSWRNRSIAPIWSEPEHSLFNDSEFSALFQECLEHLPPQWNSIIVAKYIHEVESEHICKEFSLSSANYWQIIRRAKLLLKKCLEHHWKEGFSS